MLWSKKDTWKVKNTLLHSILQNIFRRQLDVSENSKVYYMIDFYEIDFMKGINSKSRWDVQYLEVC